MGASVCLCVSAQEENRDACFYGLGLVGRRCYLNDVGLEAVAAVDVVAVATVHVAGQAGVVDVAAVLADVVVAEIVAATEIVDVALVVTVVAVAVAVAAVGIGAAAAVVASFAPTQRPSKRTHRGPSSRFDLPVIFVT